MSWIQSNLVQVMYFLDVISQILPLALTVAVIFTFFLVQSYKRKLARMEFFLDRIDNHLREITYFIKEYHSQNGEPEEHDAGAEDGRIDGGVGDQR